MASYKRFEDLPIWQKARSFSKKIFEITLEDKFSKEIRLCSQIRAASGSIMDNIAEGFERNGNGEFKQFLYIAKGSCGETRSQIYRAFDYGFISEKQFEDFISEKQFEEMKSLSEEISKSINSFIDYLNNTEIKGTKFK